ncbi:DUF2644 domain-containing protein [Wohlfahrtiimonas larvae]|uniref:Uncharacterized protein n=1 Tax=Wohlfahrtiimonas larvae TaxID=1157986 RepID=A0ABP9MWA3_9GAMM|nr:DUF2644 domain-containing protein [Wohlfahrtiimonas larvae]
MKILKEILSNDDGRYSTTNFIQIIALIALIVGFFIGLFLKSDVLEVMVIALTSIAVATPATKGFATRKRGQND